MQNVRPHGGPIVVLAAATLMVLSASASTDRKLMLTHRNANHRITLADVPEPHARMVAEYEAMSVVAVPERALERVAERLVKAGFDVTELDDTIETPRRRIRPAMDRVPKAPFETGLFILQYAAPATDTWQASLRQSGAVVVQSLPGRAVLLSASAEQITRLARFPWVEYVGPYLAEYKYAPLASPEHTEYTIQIANTSASAAAVNLLRDTVGGFLTESRYESELTARIKMKDLSSAYALLEEPCCNSSGGVHATRTVR